MINNHFDENRQMKSKDLIERYAAYLRFTKQQCETIISVSTYVLNMVARDLEVSLIDADSCEIREVLCRYYDKVKPATLNQYRSILVSFYRYLYLEDIVSANPARDIPIRKIPDKMPAFVEQSTIDKILTHDFNENNPIEFQQKCIFELMLLCGMKCGEIAKLTIYNCIISPDGISVIYDNNKKARIYPNELIVNSCIKRYIKSCSQDCIELFPNYPSTSQIRYMVRQFTIKYCDRYNITPMTLRHAFAISMINHGVRDIFVANLLGTKVLHCQSIYKYANIDVLKREYSAYFNRNLDSNMPNPLM